MSSRFFFWRRGGLLGFGLLLALAGGGLFSACSPLATCQRDTDCGFAGKCVNQRCVPKGEGSVEKGPVEKEEEAAPPDGSTEPAPPEKGPEAIPEAPPEDTPEEAAPPEKTPEARPEKTPTEGHPEDSSDKMTGFKIKIFIQGESKPVTFHDGLSGQTPKNYYLGFQKYEILRNRNDPNPATVFDLGDKYTRTSMLGRQFVAAGSFEQIPNGTYQYGKTTVAFMEFEVQATSHLQGMSFPGTLHVYYALSDHKDKKGNALKQGDVRAVFKSMGQSFPYQTHVPVKFDLSSKSTWVDTSGGKTRFYFLLGRSIVKEMVSQDMESTLHFNIYEAFRWKELQRKDYKKGVYDISLNPNDSEPVLRYGALDYRVTVP